MAFTSWRPTLESHLASTTVQRLLLQGAAANEARHPGAVPESLRVRTSPCSAVMLSQTPADAGGTTCLTRNLEFRK